MRRHDSTIPLLRAWLALALLLVSGLLHAAAAGTPAGRVIVVLGDVRATAADGTVRRLARRDAVFPGETLVSAPGGRAQIRFTDGALLALRPSTELAIDDYEFTGATTDRTALRLTRGGFRTQTGEIGRANRSAYRVSTPLAVIGIRGTLWQAFQRLRGPLLLGVIRGGISATSPNGQIAEIGDDAPFSYAQVNVDGSVELLLTEPEAFADSPEDEGGGSDEEGGDAPPEDAAAEDSAPPEESTATGTAGGVGAVTEVSVDINPNISGEGVPVTEQPFGQRVYGEAEEQRLRTGNLLGLIVDGPGASRRAIEGGPAVELDDGSRSIAFDDGADATGAIGIEPGAFGGNRSAFVDTANHFLLQGDAASVDLQEDVGGIAGLGWAFIDASAATPVLDFASLADVNSVVPVTQPFFGVVGPAPDIANLQVGGWMLLTESLLRASDGSAVSAFGSLDYQLNLGSGSVNGFVEFLFGPVDAQLGSPTKILFADFTGSLQGPIADLSFTEIGAFYFSDGGQNFSEPVFSGALEGFLVGNGSQVEGFVVGLELLGQSGTTDSLFGTLLFTPVVQTDLRLTASEQAAMDPALGGYLFTVAEGGFDGGIGIGFATDPDQVGASNVVLGFNQDVPGFDGELIELYLPGGTVFPPNTIGRRGSATLAQSINVTRFPTVTTLTLQEWAPSVDGNTMLIDNASGEPFDELLGRTFFAFAEPTGVADLTGFRIFAGSASVANPQPSDSPLIGAATVNGIDQPLRGFRASMGVNFQSGNIRSGVLFVPFEVDPMTSADSGFLVLFGGQVRADSGFAVAELETFGTIFRNNQSGFAELDGFFTGPDGDVFALSFYASAFDGMRGDDVQVAGTLAIGQAPETRLNGAEFDSLNLFGYAVYNVADLPGQALDLAFSAIPTGEAGQFIGRSTFAGATNPIFTGQAPGFPLLRLPPSYVVRRDTALTALLNPDVTLSGSPGDSLSMAGFPVSWGIWNANGPAQAVSVQPNPGNAATTVQITRDVVFLSLRVADVASLSGFMEYGGGGGSGAPIQFIGRGGNTANPTSTNPLDFVHFRMGVDFGTGVVSAGELKVGFVDPVTSSGVTLLGQFNGFVNGGLVFPTLTSLAVTQDGSPGVGGNLPLSSLGGAVTGPTGERFVGAFNLVGQGFSTDAFHAEGAFIVGPCPACDLNGGG